MSNEVKYKKQLATKCSACGIINISKYVNDFLSTKRTTLILSSLLLYQISSSSGSLALKQTKGVTDRTGM